MSKETVRELDQFAAPWHRVVRLEEVNHESGLRMLRIRIREGRRFTVMDVDETTARHWATVMHEWADSNG